MLGAAGRRRATTQITRFSVLYKLPAARILLTLLFTILRKDCTVLDGQFLEQRLNLNY